MRCHKKFHEENISAFFLYLNWNRNFVKKLDDLRMLEFPNNSL